jgi:hypothetical protein
MEVAEEMLSAKQRRERLLADADERIGRFTQSLESSNSPSASEPE